MSEPRIIYNAIRTPDGTVLESLHRHDYREYIDANGLEYMVDGGREYLRRTIQDTAPYEELSVYDNEPIEKIREVFYWGTYGKKGDEPKKMKGLAEMSDDHIKAIIRDGIYGWNDLMERELQYRRDNKFTIAD